ncbi:MAG: hypothetical protein JWM27_4105 [Gemmatimonadetes bacterium]|nr:hypothetical protein [Gemmatimonadota bacterium]
MPASLRTLALVAPLALLAACGDSPRAEAAAAKTPPVRASAGNAPAPALRSAESSVKAAPAAGRKLADPDCDPATEAAAATSASAGGPMSRLRQVMAGDSRAGTAAGTQPPRCDPNERKATATPRGAGS